MRQAFETDGVEDVTSARERLLQVRIQADILLKRFVHADTRYVVLESTPPNTASFCFR